MCIALIKPATSTEASFITYIKSEEECLTFICDTENPCLNNKRESEVPELWVNNGAYSLSSRVAN